MERLVASQQVVAADPGKVLAPSRQLLAPRRQVMPPPCQVMALPPQVMAPPPHAAVVFVPDLKKIPSQPIRCSLQIRLTRNFLDTLLSVLNHLTQLVKCKLGMQDD